MTPAVCPICDERRIARGGCQTCGDPDCTAVIKLHPEERRPLQHLLPGGKRGRRKAREIAGEIAGRPIVSAPRAKDTNILQDLRGAARPDLQCRIESRLSRVTAALRLVGKPGQASLSLRRQPGQTTAEALRDMTGGGNMDGQYDCIMSWICGCPHGHTVTYRRMTDLPAEDGYHSPCAVCGASPLEVATDAG